MKTSLGRGIIGCLNMNLRNFHKEESNIILLSFLIKKNNKKTQLNNPIIFINCRESSKTKHTFMESLIFFTNDDCTLFG